jgi:hypothetical protein
LLVIGARTGHSVLVSAHVVLEDQGDGWWEGPSVVVCEVCWNRPAKVDGLGDLFWLVRLSQPMRDADAIASFEYVLVKHDGVDLCGGRDFWTGGIPMYPVLRGVQPGEHVSFDGELLTGVKAIMYNSSSNARPGPQPRRWWRRGR